AGRTLAGIDVVTIAIRIAVLIAQHAAVPPSPEKSARKDAVLPHAVAIKVVGPLPRQNCSKMRRPHRGHEPLPRGVIRDADEANLAGAPRLRAGPLDGVVEVAKFRRRVWIEAARRHAGSARIHINYDVAVRDPHFRV